MQWVGMNLKTAMLVEVSTFWFGQPERDQHVEEDGWVAEFWLYTTHVWHRWLKVVVVIVGLKMPGGGCVPLISHLISRSRGEALNPKHTRSLTHRSADTCTQCTHRHMDMYIPSVFVVFSYIYTPTPVKKVISYPTYRLSAVTNCLFYQRLIFKNNLWSWLYDVVL